MCDISRPGVSNLQIRVEGGFANERGVSLLRSLQSNMNIARRAFLASFCATSVALLCVCPALPGQTRGAASVTDKASIEGKITAVSGEGTVFEFLRANGSNTETALYSFCKQQGCVDGANPASPLLLNAAGDLFGTTLGGGASNAGVAFALTR